MKQECSTCANETMAEYMRPCLGCAAGLDHPAWELHPRLLEIERLKLELGAALERGNIQLSRADAYEEEIEELKKQNNRMAFFLTQLACKIKDFNHIRQDVDPVGHLLAFGDLLDFAYDWDEQARDLKEKPNAK